MPDIVIFLFDNVILIKLVRKKISKADIRLHLETPNRTSYYQ